jgi:PEP-CTERM motif
MKSLRTFFLTGSAALAALTATPAMAVTTFFDDWEDTDFGFTGFTVLPTYSGWNNVSGSGIEIQHHNVAGQAFSGNNLVELDSFNNSTMEYGTLIDPGDYTLSFYYSPRPGVLADSNGIDVLLNGVSIFSITGDGGSGTVWNQQFVNFSLGAPGTLRFAAIGTSNTLGGYLDDLRLEAVTGVPEPATWALMILGFGLLGTSMRRRQRVGVSYA